MDLHDDDATVWGVDALAFDLSRLGRSMVSQAHPSGKEGLGLAQKPNRKADSLELLDAGMDDAFSRYR